MDFEWILQRKGYKPISFFIVARKWTKKITMIMNVMIKKSLYNELYSSIYEIMAVYLWDLVAQWIYNN